MINQWEDWVHGDLARFTAPVFSRTEQVALRCYQAIWLGVCRDTPDPLPNLETLIATEPWRRLRVAAQAALCVFERRGKLDEEREDAWTAICTACV